MPATKSAGRLGPGGAGVDPVGGDTAGTVGRQRQPVAAGVPHTMLPPSACCADGLRKGLLPKNVSGRPALGLTIQLTQFESLVAFA